MSNTKIHRINEWPAEKLGLRRFNFRLIAHLTGVMLVYLSAITVLPLAVSLYYRDGAQFALVVSAMAILIIGLLFRNILGHNAHYEVRSDESYWLTATIWIAVPLCGALPYLFTGGIATLADAMFESFSGFTTTGSSVLARPEDLPPSLLVYRSMTQWIGGLGMMLMVVALFSRLGISGGQLYEAEFSGTQDRKLHPRLSRSVKRLWYIYILITTAMFAMLMLENVPAIDAMCLALSTVSTGGFIIHSEGLSLLGDGALRVITLFMILSGVNVAVLYNLFTLKWKEVHRNEEMRTYLGLLFGVSAVCVLAFFLKGNTMADSISYSLFHVASTLSTCGYYIQRPEQWSFLVSAITFVLIIVGASAGSTGGGLKLRRVMILVKYIGIYFTHMIHPNAVAHVKINKQAVDNEYINKVFGYVTLYLAFIMVGGFLLTLCGNSIPNSICMAAANISNLGPSPLINNLGGNLDYSGLSIFAKGVLMSLMVAGRLELFALIAIFSPSYWRRR